MHACINYINCNNYNSYINCIKYICYINYINYITLHELNHIALHSNMLYHVTWRCSVGGRSQRVKVLICSPPTSTCPRCVTSNLPEQVSGYTNRCQKPYVAWLLPHQMTDRVGVDLKDRLPLCSWFKRGDVISEMSGQVQDMSDRKNVLFPLVGWLIEGFFTNPFNNRQMMIDGMSDYMIV